MSIESNKFESSFTEEGFWAKVKSFAQTAGIELVELSLQLYYALQATGTPAWAKAIIVSALGYFISPLDAIPDITPLIGYADDLGVLSMALATVAAYITDDMKAKAKAKSQEWFGTKP